MGKDIKDYLTGKKMPINPVKDDLIDTAREYIRNDKNVTVESMRAAWFAGWLGATKDTAIGLLNTALNPFGTGYKVGEVLSSATKTAIEYYSKTNPNQMLKDVKGILPFFADKWKNSNNNERMLVLGEAYGYVTSALVTGKAAKELAGQDKAASHSVGKVKTPYGNAVQSTSKSALQTRNYVDNGGQFYRRGEFGVQNVSDAQFWSIKNPLSSGYANKYGLPNSQLDYIIGGTRVPGAPYITRPAPGIGNNIGGGIEVVTNPNSVGLNFFHMP